MKTGVIFFSVVLYYSSFIIKGAPTESDPYASDMEKRRIMGIECLEQVKLEQSVIDKVLENQILPEQNQKYKEFLACSYKKQGYQTDDGKMQYENIVKFLSRFYKGEDLNTLKQCHNIPGETDGEMAFNHLKCILEKLRELDERYSHKEG